MEKLELRHPQKVAPRLWEECHLLLEILLRRVNGVKAQLNKPPLQPEEKHRLVKSSDQARQNHDLATRWKWAAEEKLCLSAQMFQLVLGQTQGPLDRVPDHPQEGEVDLRHQTGLLPVDDEPHLNQQREGLHQVGH
jgi:hypothetical protein